MGRIPVKRIPPLLALVALAVAGGAGLAAGAGADPEARPRVVLVTESVGRAGVVWELMIAGLRRAHRVFDVDAKVVTPSYRESYESVATRLAREGVDLVIGGLALEGSALVRAAAANPRTPFAVVDVDPAAWLSPWPPNANGVVFREQEVGYLVGYLAGLVERRRQGRDVVAAVGGMKVPPVDRFIAGYRAGVRRASPGVRVLVAYSSTFTDPERCARIASAQIERGAGVVFPVAGWCGDGALAVARRLHVWGIGVDADQSGLGSHILTSAVKRFDVAVFRSVARLVAGRTPYGGTTSLGLREGGVALGTVSPLVPRSLVRRTLDVEREILAGRIRIPAAAG